MGIFNNLDDLTEEMKIEINSWILQAEADIKTAQHSLESQDYYASSFWSQQAVEKILKALLIKKTRKLTKIHDVVAIGRTLKLPSQIQKRVISFSGVYIETRYGIIGEDIPSKKFKKEDATYFLSEAKEVLSWVKKEI